MRIAIALGLCVLLSGCVLADHKYEYGLMIDAGSSGSRIYIYTWLHRTANTVPDVNSAPLNQTQWSFKVSPGLGTFYNNLDGIAQYLSPLIDYVKQNLNQSLWSETFLYLKATGGLRALAQSDQDNVMAKTREYLHTTPFNFSSSYASVISLDQEGMFGWLAVNYLTRSLGDPTTSVGALDMGGATTEIAYVPDDVPMMHASSVTLAGKVFDVYTGGYAARGLDTALILVVNQAITEQDVSNTLTQITNPCFLTGYTKQYTLNGKTYNVTGSSDRDSCTALVKRTLLNTTVPCELDPCRFNGVYQPALVNRQYYAFSGYWYTYDTFFPGSTEDHTLGQFASQGTWYCNLTYAGAQSAYPSADPSRLANYCFTGSYISSILETYGFDDSRVIKFSGSLNGLEVTWAVGAMLFEANLLPYYPDPSVTTGHNDSSASFGAAPASPVLLAFLSLFVFAFMRAVSRV